MPLLRTTACLSALLGADALVANAPALRPTFTAGRIGAGAQMLELDATTIGAAVALFAGLGGGIGLIAFTEAAGTRESSSTDPCVVCDGKKVTTCTICKGTGEDPLADLVAGRRAMTGEGDESSVGDAKIMIDDWDDGPREIVMYEEILKDFPVKAVKSKCELCGGRGVVVCDNCEGTGFQPKYLDRLSPDDFMD